MLPVLVKQNDGVETPRGSSTTDGAAVVDTDDDSRSSRSSPATGPQAPPRQTSAPAPTGSGQPPPAATPSPAVSTASPAHDRSKPNGCLNDAPCTPFTSHGASIRQPLGAVTPPSTQQPLPPALLSRPARSGQSAVAAAAAAAGVSAGDVHRGHGGDSANPALTSPLHVPLVPSPEHDDGGGGGGGGGGDDVDVPHGAPPLNPLQQFLQRDAARASGVGVCAVSGGLCPSSTMSVDWHLISAHIDINGARHHAVELRKRPCPVAEHATAAVGGGKRGGVARMAQPTVTAQPTETAAPTERVLPPSATPSHASPPVRAHTHLPTGAGGDNDDDHHKN
jgi:hypothetical protein